MTRDRPDPPSRSDRRLPWTRARFAVLDFETTGLDLARDHVISFGVVPISEGRIEMERAVYRLVRPDAPPSPTSVTVHGLRAQDLAEAPQAEETRRSLGEALAGRFLVTWYAPVENGFLAKLLGGRSRTWSRRNIDVRGLALADGDRKRDERLSLAAAAARYGVPAADPHHALDDALVTAQLFLVLATHLGASGKGSVRGMLRLAGSAVSGT